MKKTRHTIVLVDSQFPICNHIGMACVCGALTISLSVDGWNFVECSRSPD